ncbi:hypothetical protein [Clostridium haemolyticum]|uniref:hypothetical protein n=2 Tax=Clostridium haemolyticum TaxID=84025 RepID=UPI000692053B|nr:hypothetical protein [Clostridium haemolyticum]
MCSNFNQNDSLIKKIRPVQGGYSISVVTDNHDNYMLSNNHVLADLKGVPIGTAVVQPGVLDGGKSPDDIVGVLSQYTPISFEQTNLVDCAIARVLNKRNVSPKIALVNDLKV